MNSRLDFEISNEDFKTMEGGGEFENFL